MRRSVQVAGAKLAALASVAIAVGVPATASLPAPAALASPKAKPVPARVFHLPLAGRELPGRSTESFSLVGITWPKQHTNGVTAEVRVRIGGRWTGWQRLTVEPGHGPDRIAEAARAQVGTEPLWVGSADGVQARLRTADGRPPRGARITLVDPGTSAHDAPAELDQAAKAASNLPYPRPSIITRASWGADESLRNYNPGCVTPAYTSTIRAAFVHHTAGSNTYTAAQSAALVRGIYAFHVKGNGWCDLGYNFLVDKYGRVFEGRYGGTALPVLGAHTGGFNHNSFGVAVMGTFTTTQPSVVMMDSTAKVIAWKLDGHYRDPRAATVLEGKTFNIISGHRDAKATECPGAKVYAWLGWLRTRVFDLMGRGFGTEIYAFSRQLGGEAAIGGSWYLEHVVPDGRATWFTHRDLYWSAATGPHSVSGPIRVLHRQLGDASGVLGLPSTEEQPAAVPDARVQYFVRSGAARGVWWSSGTGAHEVLDQIYRKYIAWGQERSVLGLPTSGRRVAHAPGAWWNGFSGGRIYYGPTTGTWMIFGAINRRFGEPTVYPKLGLPTADQARAPFEGGWVQQFQTGRIYSSAATGTWEMYGPIYAKYAEAGVGERLRLPTTGPHDVTGGRAQDFQGGRISWDAASNTTTVTYA